MSATQATATEPAAQPQPAGARPARRYPSIAPDERARLIERHRAAVGAAGVRRERPPRAELRAGAGEVYVLSLGGVPKYVGQAMQFDGKGEEHGSVRRFEQHCHDAMRADGGSCPALNAGLRKHGAAAFEVQVVLVVPNAAAKLDDGTGRTLLDMHEENLILQYGTLAGGDGGGGDGDGDVGGSSGGGGYNVRLGGRTGALSLETRRKMSEARKGEKHPMYGRHHTDAARAKIQEAQLDRVRYDRDGTTVLPKYTVFKDKLDVTGYYINAHPALGHTADKPSVMKFVITKASARYSIMSSLERGAELDELRARCFEVLHLLDAGRAAEAMSLQRRGRKREVRSVLQSASASASAAPAAVARAQR